MKSYWCICIDASGSKWLKKGMKYLVQPRGIRCHVLRDEHNSHRRYSNPFLKRRFKLIKPTKSFKPLIL